MDIVMLLLGSGSFFSILVGIGLALGAGYYLGSIASFVFSAKTILPTVVYLLSFYVPMILGGMIFIAIVVNIKTARSSYSPGYVIWEALIAAAAGLALFIASATASDNLAEIMEKTGDRAAIALYFRLFLLLLGVSLPLCRIANAAVGLPFLLFQKKNFGFLGQLLFWLGALLLLALFHSATHKTSLDLSIPNIQMYLRNSGLTLEWKTSVDSFYRTLEETLKHISETYQIQGAPTVIIGAMLTAAGMVLMFKVAKSGIMGSSKPMALDDVCSELEKLQREYNATKKRSTSKQLRKRIRAFRNRRYVRITRDQIIIDYPVTLKDAVEVTKVTTGRAGSTVHCELGFCFDTRDRARAKKLRAGSMIRISGVIKAGISISDSSKKTFKPIDEIKFEVA